jgi:hypothetical protein
MDFFLETIEIRIDDHILDTIITYFNKARNIFTQEREKNEESRILFDLNYL